VAFRLAPLTDRDADALVRSIRGFPLLEGYRDRKPVDLPALRNLLLKLSYLGSQVPELVELEFNPVIALPAGEGCRIVDVRARVSPIGRIL
jgi:acyl-CoA synthetase (NDP forming)